MNKPNLIAEYIPPSELDISKMTASQRNELRADVFNRQRRLSLALEWVEGLPGGEADSAAILSEIESLSEVVEFLGYLKHSERGMFRLR